MTVAELEALLKDHGLEIQAYCHEGTWNVFLSEDTPFAFDGPSRSATSGSLEGAIEKALEAWGIL